VKVLLIAQSFLPRIGGREIYQDKVLSHFSSDEVVVLTQDRMGDYASFDEDYRFRVLRSGRGLANNWFAQGRRAKARWFTHLARVCARERPDVILCETVLPDGLSGWLLNQTLGKPYVVHAMGQDLANAAANKWTRALLSALLASATKFIAISDFMGQFLIEQGADPNRVAVVVPGVNPVYLEQDDEGAELVRERYGLRGKKVIVTVSRLVERKGQDKVIEAMPAILDAVPDAVYMVVGDGPDRPRLEGMALRLGIEDQVIFVGSVPYDEAPSFYSASNVFAMPNREMPGDFEGFGIVFLEANARRLPVIGGRSGGAQHAVADGVSGFLVDPLDASDIARRLIELLHDPGLAKRLGENGRRRVEAQFSWDRSAGQVRSIISEVAICPSPFYRKVWQTAQTIFQRGCG
jgi:phosphatidylinositol alpha-1,6-mannosyltransferase